MRWGYGHKLGPFELWDALGFTPVARRMESEGMQLPESVSRMLSDGVQSFYRAADRDGMPERSTLTYSKPPIGNWNRGREFFSSRR